MTASLSYNAASISVVIPDERAKRAKIRDP